MADLSSTGALLCPDAKPIPFAQFRDKVLDMYRPPQRAPKTFAAMRQALGHVEGLLGADATTQALDTDLVVKLIASRSPDASPNTTRRHLANLRAACGLAVGWGYLRISPFTLRRTWLRAAPPSREKTHHSREEIARVLLLAARDVRQRTGWARWKKYRLFALTATVAYTGMRKNEALHLWVEDLDFEKGLIWIRPHGRNQLKTQASGQPVPMCETLLKILQGWRAELALPVVRNQPPPSALKPRKAPRREPDPRWLFPNLSRCGPWTGGYPGEKPLDCLKTLGRKAGVEGFTFLSLRHSFASHAEYWGLSDTMIQRILRHTSTRTQLQYRHADAANLRASVKGIGFGPELAAELPAPPASAEPPAEAPAAPPAPAPEPPQVLTPEQLRASFGIVLSNPDTGGDDGLGFGVDVGVS